MPLPKILRDRIDVLIRKGAAELKYAKEEEYEAGLRNHTIVEHVQKRAEDILATQFKATVELYLSTRVPMVLGKRGAPGEELHVFQACLPELQLPEWVNIPSDIDGEVTRGGWKQEPDTTPNQLQRLIDHPDEIIKGHEMMREKYVVLRATAVEKGCKPDEPIRSVFFPEDKAA